MLIFDVRYSQSRITWNCFSMRLIISLYIIIIVIIEQNHMLFDCKLLFENYDCKLQIEHDRFC